jgi:outer membrane protein assembly factor BamB
VDASPSAAQLLDQAGSAVATGPAEAARLAQEAVDRFAGKLVPWPPEPDRFRPVELAVPEFLKAHPEVLARWLATEGPVAQRQLEEGQSLAVARFRPLAPAAVPAMLALTQAALDAGRTSEAWGWIERLLAHPDLAAEDRARVEAVGRVIAARWVRVPDAAPAAAGTGGAVTWQPLWSQPLTSAWIASRVHGLESQPAAQLRQIAAADGSGLLATPTFHEGSLLVADGMQVTAMERFSGSVVWAREVVRSEEPPAGPMGDVATVVVAGDRLLTLPGYAMSEQRWMSPAILELEAGTGERIWDLRLDRLPLEAMEELFPHGRGLMLDDVAVVQARKSNSRLESAAWLLGVDRIEERLRWMVSLGAAGGLRLAASRPLGSPVLLGGDVVAASSLGVVARVGAGLGSVKWLRRWPPPLREPRDNAPPWQLPSPVADDRLVAWITPDAASIVGLDPADGRTIWRRPIGVDTPAGLVRTLLLDRDRIYAIGEDVVALPRSDPQSQLWRLSDRLGESSPVRGEVTLGTLDDGSVALVVPTSSRVLLVSPIDGGLIAELPIEPGGGNTALQGGQLAVVSGDRVTLAMPGEQGERLLRQRLAERPQDPRRGLALIELGRAWRRGELMIDGAAATARALGALGDAEATSVRAEVVQRLLDPAVLETVGPAEADRLLVLAGELARTPAQRAAVNLRQGDRAVAERRGSAAAEIYRRVWGDAELAAALLPVSNDRTVAAGELALEGLSRLDLADRQPVLEAGLAAFQAQDAKDRASRFRQLTRIAGSRAMLERHLASVPVGAEGCEAEVIACIGRPPVVEALADCGPLQPQVHSLPGTLLNQQTVALTDPPRDFAILREPRALVCRGGPQLQERWRAPFKDRATIVMAWSPAIALWSPLGQRDASLECLDPATGRSLFRIGGVSTLFKPLPQRVSEEMTEDASAIGCLRAGRLLTLVRRAGEVCALRIDGNGTPSWRLSHEGQLTLQADLSTWALALVQMQAGAPESPARITLHDPGDGSIWLEGPWPDAVGSPLWIRLLPEGVVVAGNSGVAMLDLRPGLPPRWIQAQRRVVGSEWRGSTPEWLLVKDRSSDQIDGLAIDSGDLKPGLLEVANASKADPVANIRVLPEGWLAHRFNRITLHDGSGRRVGSDAVGGGRGFDQVQPVRGGVVVADLGDREQMLEGGRPPALLLRTLEPATGLRLAGNVMSVPTGGEQMGSLDAIAGWILIGLDTRTLAIPAPPGR